MRSSRTCCCFDDLVGIGDPDAVLPSIDPDARRRRLTARSMPPLARDTPAVYVVEDAHWIDEVSESMMADFLTVIPQTPLACVGDLPTRVSRCVDPGG